MEKKVSYRELCYELNKLKEKYCLDGNFYIEDMNGFTLDDAPVRLGINWSALGTVSLDEADAFADRLKAAAEACRNFKYNGYIIDYSK